MGKEPDNIYQKQFESALVPNAFSVEYARHDEREFRSGGETNRHALLSGKQSCAVIVLELETQGRQNSHVPSSIINVFCLQFSVFQLCKLL